MFNRISAILGATWPKPCPFWGKLFERPLGFSKRKRCTKLEVSSSSSIEDMFDCMPKIGGSRDLGHAPFGENYWRAHSAFPTGSGVPNLKSLAQVVLKTCSIVCQKLRGSCDLGNAPFGRKYWRTQSASPRGRCILNLKSLAQVVLKLCSIACQKF